MKNKKQRLLRLLLIHIGIFALLGAYFALYSFKFGGGCMFKYIFGVPCPGCGLTRANISFLTGDILAAFSFHPLFFVPVPLALFCIHKKDFINTKAGLAVLAATAALFIAVFIIRLILKSDALSVDFYSSVLGSFIKGFRNF